MRTKHIFLSACIIKPELALGLASKEGTEIANAQKIVETPTGSGIKPIISE